MPPIQQTPPEPPEPPRPPITIPEPITAESDRVAQLEDQLREFKRPEYSRTEINGIRKKAY